MEWSFLLFELIKPAKGFGYCLTKWTLSYIIQSNLLIFVYFSIREYVMEQYKKSILF